MRRHDTRLLWILPVVALCLPMLANAAIDPTGCEDTWRTQPITYAFDYAKDIQPIWGQYCANCHVAFGGAPLAGLDLNPAFSYSNLVGAPDTSLSIFLVAPGDPAASLLFRKINCTAPGPFVNAGRMPLGRIPLSPTLQARIYDWIAAGAPMTLDRIFAASFEER